MTDGFRPDKSILESEPLDSAAELYVYDEGAECYRAADARTPAARPS